MSSSFVSSSWRRIVPVAVLVLGLSAACGKKGPPLPPMRYVPAAAKNLTVRQRGDVLVVRMGYPSLTTDGQSLPGLKQVELFEFSQPPGPGGAPIAVEPRQFELGAKRLAVVGSNELASRVEGSDLELQVPLPGVRPAEGATITYGVRFLATSGDVSAFSNLVPLAYQAPPAPLAGLRADATSAGVVVGWSAGASQHVAVYRRPAASRSFGSPLATVEGGESSYLDKSAQLGERYYYTASAVAETSPLVESPLAREVEVFYQDVFPPTAPTGLTALVEEATVRLVWEAVEASDLAGYRVYRREGGTEIRLTETPLSGTSYRAQNLAGGKTYSFRVTAVDRSGNESPGGAEVSATLP